MDTAKSLRERARHWRSLASHQHHGTADALLEAACELEVRASRLEQSLRQAAAPLASTDEHAPTVPPSTWRR
jgi:hypothetical protein